MDCSALKPPPRRLVLLNEGFVGAACIRMEVSRATRSLLSPCSFYPGSDLRTKLSPVALAKVAFVSFFFLLLRLDLSAALVSNSRDRLPVPPECRD